MQVMSGFDLAILGDGAAIPPIKAGGVRTVVLPPALAYGAKGDGCLYGRDSSCRIPPNSEVRACVDYV
jgi:peptidylprolyl isomerase